MRANRQDLLAILNTAGIGLTGREVLEQSHAFVFAAEHLITFNDEILYRCPTPVNFQAAVPAEDFLKVLSKLPDEEIDISLQGGEIVIKGKRRSAGIQCSVDILLPTSEIPLPGKFKPLPEGVAKTLRQAAEVCGRDLTQFLTTVVHVTPDRIEACDNSRLFRADGATGFLKEVCIPASSIDAVCPLRPTRVGLGEGWIHFKLGKGGTATVRCSHEKYHDNLDDLLTLKDARKVTLPANLAEMIERAEVMNDLQYDGKITITIEDGLLTLTSRKDTGWYKERKKVRYNDQPLKFDVHPKLLVDVLNKTHTVTIGKGRLKLEADGIQFVVALAVGGGSYVSEEGDE